MACVRQDAQGEWVAEAAAPGDAPRYRFARPPTLAQRLQAAGRSLLCALPLGALLVLAGQHVERSAGLGAVFGNDLVQLSLITLTVLAVTVAPWPGDRWLHRRYSDQILSRDGLHDLQGQVAIPRERIEGWERSEYGLELRIAADPLSRWLRPFVLVPTDSEAEAALAESLLRGEEPSP